MTITKFKLSAINCLEYDMQSGWIMADNCYKESQFFNSIEEAKSFKSAFISSLKISENEAFEVQLNSFEYELDEETGEIDEFKDAEISCLDSEILDGSEILGKQYPYLLTQQYGQYMIASGKFDIIYSSHHLTKNQWLLRIENRSFSSQVVECFKDEKEVIGFVENNPDCFIRSSVIDLSK